MAVTVQDLFEGIRAGVGAPTDVALRDMTRILAYAQAAVDRYADDAPEAVKDMAVIQIGQYLYDAPISARRSPSNVLAESGAWAMLQPWRDHRAVVLDVGDAAAGPGGGLGTGPGIDREAVIALIAPWARAEDPTPIPIDAYSAQIRHAVLVDPEIVGFREFELALRNETLLANKLSILVEHPFTSDPMPGGPVWPAAATDREFTITVDGYGTSDYINYSLLERLPAIGESALMSTRNSVVVTLGGRQFAVARTAATSENRDRTILFGAGTVDRYTVTITDYNIDLKPEARLSGPAFPSGGLTQAQVDARVRAIAGNHPAIEELNDRVIGLNVANVAHNAVTALTAFSTNYRLTAAAAGEITFVSTLRVQSGSYAVAGDADDNRGVFLSQLNSLAAFAPGAPVGHLVGGFSLREALSATIVGTVGLFCGKDSAGNVGYYLGFNPDASYSGTGAVTLQCDVRALLLLSDAAPRRPLSHKGNLIATWAIPTGDQSAGTQPLVNATIAASASTGWSNSRGDLLYPSPFPEDLQGVVVEGKIGTAVVSRSFIPMAVLLGPGDFARSPPTAGAQEYNYVIGLSDDSVQRAVVFSNRVSISPDATGATFQGNRFRLYYGAGGQDVYKANTSVEVYEWI